MLAPLKAMLTEHSVIDMNASARDLKVDLSTPARVLGKPTQLLQELAITAIVGKFAGGTALQALLNPWSLPARTSDAVAQAFRTGSRSPRSRFSEPSDES
jgi:hypothetical protein